ncbi:MAG: EpsI family protein [Rubrivivax sp.]|nr:EpsI family protein [Rubrivivax sp.]
MNAVVARPWLAPLLFVLMAAVATLGHWVQPSTDQRQSEASARFVLEKEIPTSFGSWRVVPHAVGVVANPEIQEILDRVYSQILTRTYIGPDGYRIMLSMAYGEDQRGGLQAHRPEVCYPAQGFELLSNELAGIVTPQGSIAGRRLITRLGTRAEPLTYWFSVGDKPVTGRLERRMEEVKLVLKGVPPDGLLFRVSSIDPDSRRGFEQQQRFVAELINALPPQTRKKISGL